MENSIKAIIFDLDNTLHDTEFLTEKVLEKTVRAMIDRGMKCDIEEGIKKLREIIKFSPSGDKINELALNFNCDDKIIDAGNNAYRNPDFDELMIYPETKEVLNNLKNFFRLVLITQGAYESQNKRIDRLGVRNYFDYVYLSETGKKKDSFEKALNDLKINRDQILVVGDRVDVEIKIANEMGMNTCRIMKGKYKILNPKVKIEEPDYVINSLRGLYKILDLKNEKFKIVIIGGGNGTSALLEGLKKYTDNIVAVVNVTDTGRNSGLIRKDFNILAPGDARNCLIALSNSDKLLCDLFQYRINNGDLKGYSFGNLFIAALADLTGSFENAIEAASKILKLKGRVLPSTFDNVNICAELEDGTILKEENEIIDRNNDKVYIRSSIKRVFYNFSAKANEKVISVIDEADLIVLSPGSLYTSVISNLLVDGIPQAISRSSAKKVYVCNIMSQVSQTYGYKASDHVNKIVEYLKSNLDFVVLNSKKPSEELIESYEMENAHLIENDIEEIENLGIKVIVEDLLDDIKEKKLLWEKKNLLRHDPDKIAEVLIGLV